MIDRLLAEKLVHKVSKHIKNRVTIVDKEGVVIASSDYGFVGVFHETARELITSGKDCTFVKKDQAYPGSKAGVNLTFFYRDNPVGVMGIAGTPNDSLMQIGKSVRLSVESMIEYEMLKNEMLQLNDKKSTFANMLMHEQEIDKSAIIDLASKIGCNLHLRRVPISLAKMSSEDMKKIVSRFDLLSCNEIIYLNRSDGFLVLNTIADEDIYAYKAKVENFFKTILFDVSFVCYVGSPQRDMSEFFDAFEILAWLKGYLNKKEGFYFFRDYIFDYCFSRLTPSQARNIFECMIDSFSPKMKDNYMQIAGALVENNMNINLAAHSIGIHRNTFVFRLNKLRDDLKQDPINNVNNQWLMKATYMYMKKY